MLFCMPWLKQVFDLLMLLAMVTISSLLAFLVEGMSRWRIVMWIENPDVFRMHREHFQIIIMYDIILVSGPVHSSFGLNIFCLKIILTETCNTRCSIKFRVTMTFHHVPGREFLTNNSLQNSIIVLRLFSYQDWDYRRKLAAISKCDATISSFPGRSLLLLHITS